MSYRTITLASCFLLVACGGAAPPPASAPPSSVSPPSTKPAAVDEASEGKPDPSGAALQDSTSPGAPPAKAGSRAEVDKGKGVNQAVVDTQEPLSGKLTQDDIRRILEKNGDVFGDCYTLGAGGKMKDFKGTVTVKATIGPSGAVNQAEVTKSTANNVKVDACVREAFKKIKFPRPRDGGTSVITFPIAFNGVEQVQ